MELFDVLEQVRTKAPLIQCITNFVTVNDCANNLLAAGASPTMAQNIREVEEAVAGANGLVCNLGAVDFVDSMILAGKQANKLGLPVVLDPVAAWDAITTATLPQSVKLVSNLARRSGAVIAVSGVMDVVSDGTQTALLHNGCSTMARITGSGCMLTTLIGAFCAAAHPFEAVCAAMDICGEGAEEKRLRNRTGKATSDLLRLVQEGVVFHG